jgi:hypothetical protein
LASRRGGERRCRARGGRPWAGARRSAGGAGELGGPPEAKRRRRSWAGWVAGAKNGGRRRFPLGNSGGGWLAVEVKRTEKKRAERKVACGYFLARRQDLWRRARCHADCHVT